MDYPDWSGKTRASIRRFVLPYVKWLQSDGYGTFEDVGIAVVTHLDEIQKVKPAKAAKTIVQHMSENAVNTILRQPDVNTIMGKRDAFIMLFLFKAGVRVQELVDTHLCDIRIGTVSSVTLHDNFLFLIRQITGAMKGVLQL